jgi:hypothetical protein
MIGLICIFGLLAFYAITARIQAGKKREEEDRLDELWEQGHRWKGCKEDWILKDK